MLRIGLLAVGLAAAFPALAAAGDYADREIIGFSPDGGTFAFEEYGVEDGSGFPYSNIYVVTTGDDSWVKGTPIRVRLEDENATLDDTRQQALSEAQAFLDEAEIKPDFFLAASNPFTEVSADPHEIRFIPRPIVGNSISWTVSLTEKELPAANCPDLDQSFQGFTLTLTDPDGNERTLHDDDAIPSSRKCPLSYGISDVVTAYPDGGEPVLVVIVNIFAVGFEGQNRRFLAVTTRFAG